VELAGKLDQAATDTRRQELRRARLVAGPAQ
jgi:hypothetical protein